MSVSKPFHVMAHGLPPNLRRGETVEIDGRRVAPLMAPAPPYPALSVAFDEAAATLASLPRVFFEPDGSFVWRGERQSSWQLEGELYDRGDCLDHVELRGACDKASLRTLVDALGGQRADLMFQLVRQALFLDEEAFFHFIEV